MAKMVNELNLRDVSFLNLMQRRIFNVLIVANPYDAFMLEDDGRVDEKIFSEYMQLGLRYPPVFKQVSTIDEAAATLSGTQYDLVICMPGNADNDAFDVARAVKSMSPDIPCVVLTPFSHGISRRMQDLDLSIFDYIFCWLGNTELILSIIKLIEDRMNVDNDTREADVKCVLLVEDNIRFYSSILPNLYKYILTQSLNFATEALNSQAEMLRMRGRPKVLLARSYEEAWQLYQQYKDKTLLGIEGSAAKSYFSVFNELILRNKDDFSFDERNRRPPLDPVNALLSFTYSLLGNEIAGALEGVGLDPAVGFFHTLRPGRKSLALDMLEEFRAPLADRFVLSLINLGTVTAKDFESKENGAVYLKDDARRNFLSAWQKRKQEEITHPFLKEKIAWGLVPHAQAMLLSRYLRGDLDAYPPFMWK